MSAMEKMLASMMGITPEEMQETANLVINLAKNGAEALERLQNDVAIIKAHLVPTIIDQAPALSIEDQVNERPE